MVCRMARSDHCRWGCRPRGRRASSKVVSTRQRRTNRRRMSSGSAVQAISLRETPRSVQRSGRCRGQVGAEVRSVQRKACGSFSPLGSRTSTQRIGTRMPGGGQSAEPEAMSSLRSVRPEPPSRLTLRQRVAGFSSRCFRVGSRPPLTPPLTPPLDRHSPERAGRARRCWLVEAGVEPPPGDQAQMPARIAQQLDGRDAAVPPRDHLPSRQPARGLQQRLAGAVGELLVPPSPLRGVARRRREHGQDRQRPDAAGPDAAGPDAAGPGHRGEQHHAQPAQAAGPPPSQGQA